MRSGHSGEQCARNLRCRCDCCRIKNKRDFHRKRALPWPANRGRSEAEVGQEKLNSLYRRVRTTQSFRKNQNPRICPRVFTEGKWLLLAHEAAADYSS